MSVAMLVDRGIKEDMAAFLQNIRKSNHLLVLLFSGDFSRFLQNIRKSNPFGPIVIEVDNAKIHHAKMVTALFYSTYRHFDNSFLV